MPFSCLLDPFGSGEAATAGGRDGDSEVERPDRASPLRFLKGFLGVSLRLNLT